MEFSAPYDRDLRDVLILQSEVAEAVVRTIAVTLTPDAQARLARARPIHPEAYQDYLRGAVLVEPKDRGSPQAGRSDISKRPSPPIPAMRPPTAVLRIPARIGSRSCRTSRRLARSRRMPTW